jgi:hypothetical protein
MIVAIQETRWQGSKIFHTFFMILSRVKDHMLNFQPVNEQCYLRLKGKFFNIAVLCASSKVNDDISSFYNKLDRIDQTIPKLNIGMVTGDMNARIGKNPLISCSGKYSLHEISNNNGEKQCDFATSGDLVISSIIFQHKNIHLQTWISPDGLTATHIDIMVSRRCASQIPDIRSQ